MRSTAALFTIPTTRKQRKCSPLDKRLQEMCCAHTQRTTQMPKKTEILPCAAMLMNLENIMLPEVKSEKDKYNLMSHMESQNDTKNLYAK